MPDCHGEPLDRVGDELERSAQAIDLGPVLDERGEPIQLVCLKTVEWTGIAADDPENRSGKTIPGP